MMIIHIICRWNSNVDLLYHLLSFVFEKVAVPNLSFETAVVVIISRVLYISLSDILHNNLH